MNPGKPLYFVNVMTNILKVENRCFHFARSFHQKQAQEPQKQSKFDYRIVVKLFDRNYKTLPPITEVHPPSLEYQQPAFVFPGFEGRKSCIAPLLKNLNRPIYCVQYPFEGAATGNIMDTALSIYPHLKKYTQPDSPINIIAHSFGGVVAFDIIKLLETEGRTVRLCLSDSSPYALKKFGTHTFGNIQSPDFEQQFLTKMIIAMGVDNVEKHQDIINSKNSWNEKVHTLSPRLEGHSSFTSEDVKVLLIGFYHTVTAMLLYDESFDKFKCKATLVRPIERIWNFPEDYRINQFFEQPVRTFWTDGHHVNMLKQKKTAFLINQILEGNESTLSSCNSTYL